MHGASSSDFFHSKLSIAKILMVLCLFIEHVFHITKEHVTGKTVQCFQKNSYLLLKNHLGDFVSC